MGEIYNNSPLREDGILFFVRVLGDKLQSQVHVIYHSLDRVCIINNPQRASSLMEMTVVRKQRMRVPVFVADAWTALD